MYPLVDYAPRTQMGSNIDGLISVEQRREQGVSLGTGGSGKVDALVHAPPVLYSM